MVFFIFFFFFNFFGRRVTILTSAVLEEVFFLASRRLPIDVARLGISKANGEVLARFKLTTYYHIACSADKRLTPKNYTDTVGQNNKYFQNTFGFFCFLRPNPELACKKYYTKSEKHTRKKNSDYNSNKKNANPFICFLKNINV